MLKKILYSGLAAALVLAAVGCNKTVPETGSEITTQISDTESGETVAEGSTEESTETEADDLSVVFELTGIDDNTLYVHPSSDQLTPQEVELTKEEVGEIIGFINNCEKTVDGYDSNTNVFFKDGDISVSISTEDSVVVLSGEQEVSAVLNGAMTLRIIEIINEESGIDLSAYFN